MEEFWKLELGCFLGSIFLLGIGVGAAAIIALFFSGAH